jgi:hypothetical protein
LGDHEIARERMGGLSASVSPSEIEERKSASPKPRN